jgi:hypothetical protein
MQNTPDLSGIINLIMQNPSLIAEISALAKPKAEPVEEADTTESVTEKEQSVSTEDHTEEKTVATAAPLMRTHRHELLNAMKPYLSESRRSAIDSMASILDLIDVMIKK